MARAGRPRLPGRRSKATGRLVAEPTKAQRLAALSVVVQRRARDVGLSAEIDDAAIAELRQPWNDGSTAGAAIRREHDVSDLWEMVQLVRTRRAAYLAVNGIPYEHPLGMRAVMASEPNSSDEARPYDPRDEVERYRAVNSDWAEVRSVLAEHDPMLVMTVVQVAVHDARPPVPAEFLMGLRLLFRRMRGK